MHGCNSCKYLDEKGKKPGRTSGYVYFCKMKGAYVNGAKDNCDSYEEDIARSTADRNEIYRDGNDYNDSANYNGCNSCGYLDYESKKPGKAAGALYYCKKKNAYVNGAKDYCEQYESGLLGQYEKNKVFEDGQRYDDDNTPIGSYLFILIFLIIFALIYMFFIR